MHDDRSLDSSVSVTGKGPGRGRGRGRQDVVDEWICLVPDSRIESDDPPIARAPAHGKLNAIVVHPRPPPPPPPSLSTWNRPEPELQSEREMGEGSAQLGPHRIASCDPNHKSPVLLQCPVYPAAAIGRAAKLWRIERAPSMPTPRCFAVAGGTACLPLQPLAPEISRPTHSLTHQPTRQPLIAGCCCGQLLLPLASHQCQDRINHARPTQPPPRSMGRRRTAINARRGFI
jgi:hypothetical protein